MYKKGAVVNRPVYSRGINEMTISNGDIKVSDAFGYWFSGFTDGEGCFEIGKRNGRNPCANYKCHFTISLRDDDQFILEAIHGILDIGTIRNVPARTNDARNRQPQVEWVAYAIADCAKLVEIFERFPLQAKKQKDFSVWRCAVVELQKPVSNRNPELLDYYFHRIRQVRQYEASQAIPKPVIVDTQLMIDF